MLAKFHALDMLIELDGKVAGYGNVTETSDGRGNVGIILEESARGREVGKISTQVFTQIAFDLSSDVRCATLKANKPMRALAESLGLEEEDEITEFPGRGVISEIYTGSLAKTGSL